MSIVPFLDEESQTFSNWLTNAKPGDKFRYHLGEHLGGIRVARKAFDAYENGLVELFQRKEAGEFGYWAMRKGK